VRCAPNKLVFNTVEAYQDIYQNDRLSKARNYLVTRGVGHDSVFSALDKKLHSHKRKIVGRAVSEKSMREFEPIMMQHIDTLIDQLDKDSQEDQSTNMTTYIKRFGFDVVSDLAFGESLNLLTNDAHRWVVEWVEMLEVQVNTHLQAPTIKWTGIDIPLFIMTLLRKIKFVKIIQGLMNRRIERGRHDREDFFAFMMDSKDPFTGKDTTMPEFLEEALFFFPAGTTSPVVGLMHNLLTPRDRWRDNQRGVVRTIFLSFTVPRLPAATRRRSSLHIQDRRRHTQRLKTVELQVSARLLGRGYAAVSASNWHALARTPSFGPRASNHRRPCNPYRHVSRCEHLLHPPQRQVLPRPVHLQARALALRRERKFCRKAQSREQCFCPLL